MHTSLRVTGVLSGVESSVVLGLGWRAVQRLHRLVETGVEIPGVAMVQLALQQTHLVVSHRRCKWSSDVGSLEDQFEEGAYVRVEEVIAC